MFKKTSLSLLVLAGFSSGAALAANTITFQGEVTGQTCQVSVNGQSAPIVLLPSVPTSQLTAPGSTAGLTPFTLTLTHCTAPSADLLMKVKFHGQGVTDAGNLRNLATGQAAEHVSIQLTKDGQGSTPLDLSSGVVEVDSIVLPAGQSSTSHTFAARYVSSDGNATAGAVQAVVEYAISYQ